MQRLPYTYRGLIGAPLTPFLNDSKRTLNLSIIPQYAKFFAERGINGVLVNGTNGEGPAMNVEERKATAEAWARAVKSTKQHLMIQVGGAPLPDVQELAKHAETIGADSLLCLPELYFKPNAPRQLVEYLQHVAQAAPKTPLIYYHSPTVTNVNINMPEFLASVGKSIPSLVGIKFNSPDLEEAMQAVHLNNKEFVVFLSDDQILARAFALGIDSAMVGIFNVLPELGVGILEASTSGDTAKAQQMQDELSKAVTVISKYANWSRIEALKAAMGLLTPLDVGPPRAPLTPLSSENVVSLRADLKALGYQVSK